MGAAEASVVQEVAAAQVASAAAVARAVLAAAAAAVAASGAAVAQLRRRLRKSGLCRGMAGWASSVHGVPVCLCSSPRVRLARMGARRFRPEGRERRHALRAVLVQRRA